MSVLKEALSILLWDTISEQDVEGDDADFVF